MVVMFASSFNSFWITQDFILKFKPFLPKDITSCSTKGIVKQIGQRHKFETNGMEQGRIIDEHNCAGLSSVSLSLPLFCSLVGALSFSHPFALAIHL